MYIHIDIHNLICTYYAIYKLVQLSSWRSGTAAITTMSTNGGPMGKHVAVCHFQRGGHTP